MSRASAMISATMTPTVKHASQPSTHQRGLICRLPYEAPPRLLTRTSHRSSQPQKNPGPCRQPPATPRMIASSAELLSKRSRVRPFDQSGVF
jgi:hypothetical protein